MTPAAVYRAVRTALQSGRLIMTFDLSEQAVVLFWRQMIDAAAQGPAIEVDMSDAEKSNG